MSSTNTCSHTLYPALGLGLGPVPPVCLHHACQKDPLPLYCSHLEGALISHSNYLLPAIPAAQSQSIPWSVKAPDPRKNHRRIRRPGLLLGRVIQDRKGTSRTRVFTAQICLLAPPIFPKVACTPLLLDSPLSPAFVVILTFLYLTSISHSQLYGSQGWGSRPSSRWPQ